MAKIAVTDAEFRQAKELQSEMRSLSVRMTLKECYAQIANEKLNTKIGHIKHNMGRIF